MRLTVEAKDFNRLEEALKDFQGNAEEVINDVLHNFAGPQMQESILRLMPVSNKRWKGKKPAAKTGKSLTQKNHNLGVTVTTTKNYQYLYFPDDGTNTKNHAGNQQFFWRGGEAVKDDIIERCVGKITNEIEKGA